MFYSQWSCKVSQECQLNTGDMCFWISIEGFTLSRSVGTIQQVCSVNDVLRVLLVMLAVVHPQTVSPVPVLLLFQLISKYISFFLFSWIHGIVHISCSLHPNPDTYKLAQATSLSLSPTPTSMFLPRHIFSSLVPAYFKTKPTNFR